MNLRDNVKVRTRQLATQSCHTFASSINLDENNDEMNSSETLERPIGKKAEKEKLKKRKNCDDVVPMKFNRVTMKLNIRIKFTVSFLET